jgi:hypothetical protein
MAWNFVPGFKKLCTRVNGNAATIVEYDNVKLFDLRIDEYNAMTANPVGNYNNMVGYASGGSQYDQYTQLLAMNYSNLNINTEFLSTNGYIDIYNPEFGDTFKIRITKQSGGFIEVRFYNRTQNTGSRWVLQDNPTASNYDMKHINLGFMFDPSTAHASFMYVRAWRQNTGSEYIAWRQFIGGFDIASEPSNYNIVSDCIFALLNGNEIEPLPEGDPNYQGGLNNQSAGGDGGFDDTSDIISEPSAPTISASSSGLVTVYNPTLSEIQSLAQALVNPNIFQALAQSVIKLSDVIIGLSIFPFSISDGGQQEIKINVLGVQLSTGVQCNKAAKQFETVDCGYLDIAPYWGNCLDYSPYTKISIYLPYVGYQELNTDEIMGQRLTLKYRIDLVSGACMAIILVNNSVLYQFSGTCSAQIPISNENYDGLMNSVMSLISDAKVSDGKTAVDTGNKNKSPNIIKDNSGAKGGFFEAVGEHIPGLTEAAVGVVNAIKPSITHAGSVKAAPGFLGVQTPFIIIERPHQCLAENYNNFHGYPCNMYKKLGDLTGYTEVDSIHLNIPDATANEIAECEHLLRGGIVI